MVPRFVKVSPLEELDKIIVILHVFGNHFSVLHIDLVNRILT